jgi:hypothetical protein
VLGGRVAGQHAVALEAGGGADVHDRAAAACAHQRYRRADGVERREQVGGDDQLELVDGEVLQARGRAVHPRVVDQPVQAAEALRGVGDPGLDLR